MISVLSRSPPRYGSPRALFMTPATMPASPKATPGNRVTSDKTTIWYTATTVVERRQPKRRRFDRCRQELKRRRSKAHLQEGWSLVARRRRALDPMEGGKECGWIFKQFPRCTQASVRSRWYVTQYDPKRNRPDRFLSFLWCVYRPVLVVILSEALTISKPRSNAIVQCHEDCQYCETAVIESISW